MEVLNTAGLIHGILLVLIFISSLNIRFILCSDSIEAPVILNGTVIKHLEGQTLTLSCEGEEKLKWSHSHFDIKKNGKVNTTHSRKEEFGSRKKYSSTLTFKNMQQGESGVLFCEYASPNLTSYNDNVYIQVYKDGTDLEKKHRHGFFSPLRIIIVVIVGLLIAIAILAVLLHRYKSNLRELRDKLRDRPEVQSEEELRHLKTNEVDKTENKYHHRRRVGQTDEELDFDEPDSLPLDSRWEFPRKRLKLGAQIGSGAFGRVLKAEAVGILPDDPNSVTTVAVKMVKGNADESHVRALMCELKVMANLGRNINVVNLLGACTKDCMLNNELYVIVEFCTRGSLLSYIRRNNKHFINQLVVMGNDEIIDTNMSSQRTMSLRRKPIGESDNLNYVVTTGGNSTSDSYTGGGRNSSHPLPSAGATSTMSFQFDFGQEEPITTTDLLCWAFQIARGMEYLASRKVIHGDLAARNVLLTDNNVVKICDFGLAKEMYKDYYYKMSTKTKEGKFPIKWMAIESILYGELSTESDCWSFGVVLWELFSLGKLPYIGIKADDELIRRIENGYRMEKPEYAPSSIYNIMNRCWAGEKRDRPTFSTLVDAIGAVIEGDVRDHYVQLNRDYVNGNQLRENSQDRPEKNIVSQTAEPQLDSSGYLQPNSLSSSMRQERPRPSMVKRSATTAESSIAVSIQKESGNNLEVSVPSAPPNQGPLIESTGMQDKSE